MTLKTILTTTALGLGLSTAALADGDWNYDPENNEIGRIYYYERTNSDGTMDERVTVFRRDETRIDVYKENGLCYGAALVTADLDFETYSAPTITGGRLQPDAQHMEFAWLEWDRDAAAVTTLVQLPNMELRHNMPTEGETWHLFDFDLASLTMMTPHLSNPDAGFDFGMALFWADPNASNAEQLYWMGDIEARPAGVENRLGHEARLYTLSGSAFDVDRATGSQGQLWLDAEDGHVVDAIFPAPNHPGYTDFRLRLLNVSDGGDAEWTALLRAHYEGCE